MYSGSSHNWLLATLDAATPAPSSKNSVPTMGSVRQSLLHTMHPQARGSVKRLNRSIRTALANVVSSKQTCWEDKLPYIQLAYHSADHETILTSPCQVLITQRARTKVYCLANYLHPTSASPPAPDPQDPQSFSAMHGPRAPPSSSSQPAEDNRHTRYAPYSPAKLCF